MSKKIANVSIDLLKAHPGNTEFFDDISGKENDAFRYSLVPIRIRGEPIDEDKNLGFEIQKDI